MKEEFLVKVLDEASYFISDIQINKLRSILEEKLYKYELVPMSTALVLINNLAEKIYIFLASKKLDGRSINTLEAYRRCLITFNKHMQKNVQDINAMDIRLYLAAYR